MASSLSVSLLLALSATVSVLGKNSGPEYCPDSKSFQPCTCDYEGINCNRAKSGDDLKRAFLVRPPKGTQFRNFWMIGSPIKEIPARTFEKFAFKQMIIENNQIASIGEEAFAGGSVHLNIISLNNNLLTEIPLSAIRGLKYLSQLRLVNNRITQIPDYAFESFTVLASINLANNRITKIGQKAFNTLYNLVELNLGNNQLTILEDYTFFTSHRTAFRLANFAGNRISNVSQKAFEGCQGMGEMILVSNKLETLDKNAFGPLFQLMTNGASTRLHLNGNPIKCDKRLEWLLSYSSSIRQRIQGLRCNGKLPADMTIDDLSD